MWLSAEKPVYNLFFEKSTEKLNTLIKTGFELDGKIFLLALTKPKI